MSENAFLMSPFADTTIFDMKSNVCAKIYENNKALIQLIFGILLVFSKEIYLNYSFFFTSEKLYVEYRYNPIQSVD